MTPTILTNLALSKIGHTLVKALGDTTSKEARLAALHYEPCLREALRAHFWSFAMTTRPLAAVDVREYLDVTGPLKAGGTALTFPRLYLQGGDMDGKPHYVEAPDADSEVPVSSAWWSAADTEWVLEHGMQAAQWRRGLDVQSPEMVTLRPHSPRHFLETKLEGLNNDIIFTQVDQALVPAAIEYAAPAVAYLSSHTINGRTLRVIPGSKARMAVTGSITPSQANETYLYSGMINSRPAFTGAWGEINWTGTMWRLKPIGIAPNAYTSSENVVTPDLVATWTPAGGVTGSPAVAAGVSSANQIITAINADAPVSAIVSVAHAVGSSGTGAVTIMPKASLSGGATGTPVIRRVTPGTELLGWTHAFELPADFIKAKTLHTAGGRKIDQFAIRRVTGKTCILCNCDAVSLEYVQYINDPASFDPLFVKAFTTLLAAKLARAISGSDDLESRFLQIFETVDLPAARTASGHETDSDENHPLRALLDGTLTPGRGDFFPRTSRTHGGGPPASPQSSPNYQTITFDTEAEQVVIHKGGKTIRINGTVDS